MYGVNPRKGLGPARWEPGWGRGWVSAAFADGCCFGVCLNVSFSRGSGKWPVEGKPV